MKKKIVKDVEVIGNVLWLNYKGYDIRIEKDKEFKEDPFWEIGGIQYDSIKQAKIDIDDNVYK